ISASFHDFERQTHLQDGATEIKSSQFLQEQLQMTRSKTTRHTESTSSFEIEYESIGNGWCAHSVYAPTGFEHEQYYHRTDSATFGRDICDANANCPAYQTSTDGK
ncbi:unnamed protein product, partial [Amoebophrya sp. A120]